MEFEDDPEVICGNVESKLAQVRRNLRAYVRIFTRSWPVQTRSEHTVSTE